MFKKIILIALSIIYLKATDITYNKIIDNTFGLRVSSCITKQCIANTKKKLTNENIHIIYSEDMYKTYIVNIKDKKTAKKLEEKYSKIFFKVDIQDNFLYFLNNIKQVITKQPIIKKTQIKKPKITKQKSKKLLAKYSLALEYFKAKDYEKAYKLFDELFKITLNEVNVNFFLGKSAFETKRFHEATIAYQRVLFEIPNNIGATIETAKVSIVQENYKEAEVLLNNIKKHPKITKETLQNIQRYLETIDDKKQKHFISGMLMIGINYDSNINSSSLNDTFTNVYLPMFNMFINMQNTTIDESANAHQEIAIINYKYKLNKRISILNDFMIYNKMMTNDKFQDKDIKLYSYTPSIDMRYENGLNLNLALKYDQLKINNINNLKTYSLATRLNYNLNKVYTINHNLKYQDKRYQIDEDKTKDSIFIELNNNIQYRHSKKLSFSPTVVLFKERVKDNTTKGTDFDAINFKFSTTYMYLSNLIFTPSISITTTKYKDEDTMYLTKRKDSLKEISLTSTYVVSPVWVIQAGVTYKKQTSSVQPNEYKKHTAMFNIIRSFK